MKTNYSTRWLRLDEVWTSTKGSGVKVAVLDTGISFGHPDLSSAITSYQDFTGSRGGAADQDGHGTHCAGIIGARGELTGVAPECDLLIGKVVADDGSCDSTTLARGIRWAYESGADICSISIGGAGDDEMMHEAIRISVSRGCWIIAAAGNAGEAPFAIGYPGAYEEVISVGSVGKWPHIVSEWSSRGDTLDIVAPGKDILSCFPPKTYQVMSGTSMACPFVSGVLALAISKHRLVGGATPIDSLQAVRDHLLKTAIDRGKHGPDDVHGWGIISPRKVVEA